MSIEKKVEAEEVMPYGEGAHKGEQVSEMFDSIAPAYDFMNTAMSFGLHRRWRNIALKAAMHAMEGKSVVRILDIATGTGDLAFDLHHRYPEAQITGMDISDGMLKIAEEKLKKSDESAKKHIRFEHGDSLAINAPSDTYDLVTVAYGVRNFERLADGFAEMYRVLRPGGTLCVIELSVPKNSATRAAYNIYSGKLIPLVGRWVSGDKSAYTYLPESIKACPQRRDLAMMMRDAGFRHCRWRSLTFGAVTFYLATKP